VRKLDPAVVTVSSRTPQPADRCRPASLRSLVGICTLYVGLAVANSGCGTTHAVLNFTAPHSATAGLPFTVTVTATINGNRDTVINSRIHFTSSDPAAVLPGDYYFTSADAGSHTWVNGFTLNTPGNQTISGAIVDAVGINGTATISVSLDTPP
jgi:hypothetical protein